jgi:pimeloyl-ACP methyl ester carboxylesterase
MGDGLGASLLGVLQSLAGGALFGETWGEGPPAVVALHGWRRTHADFAPSLGPSARCGAMPTLAPDLPGFGATPEPPAVWGSVEYAEAVTPLLGDAPGPEMVVVGHSLGGRVAVQLAARHPERVGALVLTGAPLLPRDGRVRRSPLFRAARALHRFGIVGDEQMERVRRRHGSADYRAAHGVMRDVLVRLVNERYEDALAAIRCPVELVWGEDDAEVPVATAQALVSLVPTARLTVIPGAGHLTPLVAPDALRDAVERAFARRGS